MACIKKKYLVEIKITLKLKLIILNFTIQFRHCNITYNMTNGYFEICNRFNNAIKLLVLLKINFKRDNSTKNEHVLTIMSF